MLDASKALEAANATGDAQQIRAAMQALEAALRGQAQAAEAVATANKDAQSQAEAQSVAAPAAAEGEAVEGGDAAAAAPATPAAPKPAARPVVAVRGDDRPGMKKDAPVAPGRGTRPGDRRDGRPGDRDGARGPRADGRMADRGDRGGRFGDRPAFEDRGPRLGDTAFRAQREAMEHAQLALKKLAAQAHGEALTQLLTAWEKRDAALVPGAQELGSGVTASVRSAWTQALSAAPKGDAAEAMLRLEMAAEAPTPAEHIAARRMLQLQLLTRRNDPAPAQTWGQDVARVLAGPSDAASARRLQNVLKTLLRK